MNYQRIYKHRHWFISLLLFCFFLIFAYYFVFYFIPRVLPENNISNTQKQGIIFQNERWSGEITITGDIWAFPGTTVTVASGTKVIVLNEDHSNLHFLPWDLRSGLNVDKASFGVKNGELFRDEAHKIQLNFAKVYALSTKEQPIEITSKGSDSPSPYDFNGLTIEEGILGNVELSNYRKLVIGNKVTIRDSKLTNSGECAICTEYNSPTISNNIFNGNIRNYIWILGGSPKISDNLFQASKGEGIVFDPKIIAMPIIYHNSFEMPDQIGLHILSGNEEEGGVIAFNDFAGENKILLPCDSKMKFIQNQMRGVIEFADSGNCSGTMIMGPNYWLSHDRNAIIREKFINKEGDFQIILPSVLTSSPSTTGRRK